MAGVSQAAMQRHMVVRQGERPATAVGLPLLTTFEPACGPLWRLFDGTPLPFPVKRQAQALCVRCGVRERCSQKVA